MTTDVIKTIRGKIVLVAGDGEEMMEVTETELGELYYKIGFILQEGESNLCHTNVQRRFVV